MKELLKKILSYRPGKVVVALGALAVLAVLLLPLFRIAGYSAPWYDDYNYGGFVKRALTVDRSLPGAWVGAYFCIRTQWYIWQGTFSSIFFMCMAPYAWNESLYYLGPVFLIVILAASTFVLLGVICRKVLGMDAWVTLPIQTVTAAMAVEFIYSIHGGFYWYNAGVHYVGMHSMMLLLAAAWIFLLKGSGTVKFVLAVAWTMLGAVIAGGANFITALQGILLGLSLIALGALLRSKRTLALLPSMMVYAFAFYKNVSAPGNQVRKNVNVSAGLGMDPVSAIWRSFVEAGKHAWTFTGVSTLLVLILLAVLIWRGLKDVKFSFRFPALLTAWSFCLFATGFTPSLYSLGHAGLSRTLNAVKITWQVLLVINEIYWIGWAKGKLKSKERGIDQGARWWFYPLIGVLMLGAFFLEPRPFENYSSYAAYYFVHTGEAHNFYHEYLDRVETITQGGEDVCVTPYHYRPGILMPEELTGNPADEKNRSIADWYGKNSITCVSP